MPRLLCPVLLTLSQVFLAGALPAGPRFISKYHHSRLIYRERVWNYKLICMPLDLVAEGRRFEVGPPLFASFPDGNPFTNPFTTYVYTPHGSATAPPTAASSSLDAAISSVVTASSQPGGVAHEVGQPSTITFGDPHLSIQTFTVTSLNSSQIPTSTLENQSSLAPTGVRFFLKSV